MRKMSFCLVVVACLMFRSAGMAWADPSSQDCSDPVKRQQHLEQCNQKHDPWSRYPGSGGGGPRGLLGLGGIL